MEAGPTIQFLTNSSIDKKKWDNCVRAAGGLIYGYAFYLDHMAAHWDALVLMDQAGSGYTAVMPLTWNRKYGITYLHQPFLTPQLGVFGANMDEANVKLFLEALQSGYKFAEINLNTSNRISGEMGIFTEHKNYFLSLRDDYMQIASRFNTNLVRNCKKAAAAGAIFKNDIPLQEVLRLAGEQLEQYTRLKKDDLSRFKSLCELLLEKKTAITLGVYLGNFLVASCILFLEGNRAYYILAGNHVEGKKIGASHFLLEQYIKQEAGKDLILDFVGSDIESITFFYEGFGATWEKYYSLRYNRLPGLVKLFKK